jgi:hypothetical protein
MQQQEPTQGIRDHLEVALNLAQNPEQKRHIRESLQLLESLQNERR